MLGIRVPLQRAQFYMTFPPYNFEKLIRNLLNLLDPIEAAIPKHKNHPSLCAIRSNMSEPENQNLHFEYTC